MLLNCLILGKILRLRNIFKLNNGMIFNSVSFCKPEYSKKIGEKVVLTFPPVIKLNEI